MDMGWFIIICGLIVIGVGSFLTFYGQTIVKNTKYDSTTMDTSSYILSPQAEKLLSVIYKYQKDLGLNKLIIGRDGVLCFDEKEEKEKHKINIIGEVFNVKSNYSSRAKEFENLVLSIPSDFLKTIPETRFGSPYIVQVTKEGISYLKKD